MFKIIGDILGRRKNANVSGGSADSLITQMYKTLLEGEYKIFGLNDLSQAFISSMAFSVGAGVIANSKDLGKVIKDEPLEFFLVSHVCVRDPNRTENHYVVGARALASDLDADTGALFPTFVSLKDFVEQTKDRDIQEFFESLPRATLASYSAAFNRQAQPA